MRIWLLLPLMRMWLLLLRPSRVFALAKGFRGKAKNCFRIANSQAEEALEHQVAARRLRRHFISNRIAPAAASEASRLSKHITSESGTAVSADETVFLSQRGFDFLSSVTVC